MATELEDTLARLCDRQTKKIEELVQQRDELIEAANVGLNVIKSLPEEQHRIGTWDKKFLKQYVEDAIAKARGLRNERTS